MVICPPCIGGGFPLQFLKMNMIPLLTKWGYFEWDPKSADMTFYIQTAIGPQSELPNKILCILAAQGTVNSQS